MKKFFKIILTTLICCLTICCFAKVSSAATLKLGSSKVQISTQQSACKAKASLSLSEAKSMLIDGLGTKEYKKLLLKSPLEICNRAKKIADFYELAYGDGFAHLYHPNKDLSINEEEILQGLPTDNSLCIILFGNKLNEDGSMSDKFIARCKTALAMANKYPNALILVTGGHTAGWNLPAEAVVGKQWLVEHGVDANRIITEENSWDTGSNMLCSLLFSDLAKHKEVKNFVIVSSDYHVPRCSFSFMGWVYLFGYDRPTSQGGRGYKFLGNIGAVLD